MSAEVLRLHFGLIVAGQVVRVGGRVGSSSSAATAHAAPSAACHSPPTQLLKSRVGLQLLALGLLACDVWANGEVVRGNRTSTLLLLLLLLLQDIVAVHLLL